MAETRMYSFTGLEDRILESGVNRTMLPLRLWVASILDSAKLLLVAIDPWHYLSFI
jgi:hypothetical protein